MKEKDIRVDIAATAESTSETESTLVMPQRIPVRATTPPLQSTLRGVTNPDLVPSLGSAVPMLGTRQQREPLLLHHLRGKALTHSRTKPRYNTHHQVRMVTAEHISRATAQMQKGAAINAPMPPWPRGWRRVSRPIISRFFELIRM
jgi:hypothetical protein